MDGSVISHWVHALDDFIIVSMDKLRSYLTVSIKVSLGEILLWSQVIYEEPQHHNYHFVLKYIELKCHITGT